MSQYTSDFITRFWAKVAVLDDPDACWLWTAGGSKLGYGHIKCGKKVLRAYRVSFELNNGPIPEGLCVLHACDNPPCVNPRHLFVGTQGDNVRDMERKGRAKHPTGDEHGQKRLTALQVAEIRRNFAEGQTNKAALGRAFGVTDVLIGLIVRNRIWRG